MDVAPVSVEVEDELLYGAAGAAGGRDGADGADGADEELYDDGDDGDYFEDDVGEDDDGRDSDDEQLIRTPRKQPFHVRYAWAICLGAFLLVGGAIVGAGAAFYAARGALLRYNTTVILVSLDGFRPEYLERGRTANLTRLATMGVRAPYMRPSFPSKTFPNHYTLVTGLYPETHGIVSNTFFDPEFNTTFSVGDTTTTSQARWWGGEPFWNTVQKAGLKSACYYWPGSEAPIQDMRPTYYKVYNHVIPNNYRVDQVIEWLQQPWNRRPHFVTLYLSVTDDAGHAYGTSASETNVAIAEADLAIGYLLAELAKVGLLDKVNVIVVSDHGMTDIKRTNVRFLDDYISLDQVSVVDWSPVTAIFAKPGISEEELFTQLQQGSLDNNFRVYWKNSPNETEHAPARYRYDNNARIAPLLIEMDEGYSMSDSKTFQINPEQFDGGTHGYDNELDNMQAIFIASGPAFRNGTVIDPFEGVELYNLLATIMNVRGAPNNGSADSQLLRQALHPRLLNR